MLNMPNELFYRQRRNLILMSLLVVFINAVGGNITKINILGNEMNLSHPEVMPTIFGFVLAYFLWRFFQYAHEIDNKGFKDTFLLRVQTYLKHYLLKREYFKNESKLRPFYPNIKMLRVETVSLFWIKAPNEFEPVLPNAVIIRLITSANNHEIVNNEPVSILELMLPSIRASIYIIFRSRLATEFIFPPVFSFIAFATYLSFIRSSLAAWF